MLVKLINDLVHQLELSILGVFRVICEMISRRQRVAELLFGQPFAAVSGRVHSKLADSVAVGGGQGGSVHQKKGCGYE
ncbi:hypothetical protein [Luteimonas qiangzhengi]|uniref:hypothetical protein n=1 Tax=Luteimonas sp. MJ146 TaxID=3129240 RepID=UPI0031BB4285